MVAYNRKHRLKPFMVSNNPVQTRAVPEPSAAIHIDDTNGGFLTARMTTVQRDLIQQPTPALLIWNWDITQFEYYDGITWVPLSSGGAVNITDMVDADSDTRLSVEKTADNDTLTLDIGDNTGNYTGLTNQLSWSTSGINITASSGLAAGNTAGTPISITSGSGADSGNGGNIMIAAGGSGILAGQAGKITIRTADKPAGAIGSGGDIIIDAGNTDTSQGGRIIQTAGDGGTTGFGGQVIISGGLGGSVSGTGGASVIRGGGSLGSGDGGPATLQGGTTNTGVGGLVLLQPGRSSTGGAANFGWVVIGADPIAPTTGELRFKDGTGTGNNGYVGFKGPINAPSNQVWTLPAADGATGDALTTDGTGNLSWVATINTPTVVGSRTVPVATDGLTTIILPTVANENIVFVEGLGGPVVATVAIPFTLGTSVGERLTVIGGNNTNTVQYNSAGLLILNGSIVLGQSSVLNLMWDGSFWLETGRNI